MNLGALVLATFLACLVEAVEAATIVLASGSTRGWRSAGQGTLAALAVLAVGVAAVGPAIVHLPIDVLRILVGGLLLIFGIQWVRKAVLRASGRKPLHDEDAIYRREVEAARRRGGPERRGVVEDWYGFTLAFKGVLLEGLEVVFIVLTFGANARSIGSASLAAAAAVVLVVVLAVAVRGPLSRVPENTLKFVVGVMLTSFGLFWGAEGAGAAWPGSDAALLALVPAVLVFALVLVAAFRPRGRRTEPSPLPAEVPAPVADAVLPAGGGTAVRTRPEVQTPAVARAVRGFVAFWVDFLIGDDWQVAAAVALGLAATAGFALAAPSLAWLALALVVAGVLPYSAVRALR